MKFIRKHILNEGYFKPVSQMKDISNKTDVPNKISAVTRKVVLKNRLPEITYHLFNELCKSFADDKSKIYKSQYYFDDSYPIRINTRIVNIRNFQELCGSSYPENDIYYSSWYNEYNDNFGEEGNAVSPIKSITLDEDGIVATVRTMFMYNKCFCFCNNDFLDEFTKIEKRMSKHLDGISFKIKLVLLKEFSTNAIIYDDTEIPIPPKDGRNNAASYREAIRIEFVKDVDFNKVHNFLQRYTTYTTNNFSSIRFLSVDIPSLSYLPDFNIKTYCIEFAKIRRNENFKYQLDSLGDYTKLLTNKRYMEPTGPVEPAIYFYPGCFDPEEVPRLSNGIITSIEYEFSSKECNVPVSFNPYTGNDTCSPRVKRMKNLKSYPFR